MTTERKLISFWDAAMILNIKPQGLEFHWYRRCQATCPCRKVTMGMLDAMFGRRILYKDEVEEWARERQGVDKG